MPKITPRKFRCRLQATPGFPPCRPPGRTGGIVPGILILALLVSSGCQAIVAPHKSFFMDGPDDGPAGAPPLVNGTASDSETAPGALRREVSEHASAISPDLADRLARLDRKLDQQTRAGLLKDLRALDPALWSFLLGYYENQVEESQVKQPEREAAASARDADPRDVDGESSARRAGSASPRIDSRTPPREETPDAAKMRGEPHPTREDAAGAFFPGAGRYSGDGASISSAGSEERANSLLRKVLALRGRASSGLGSPDAVDHDDPWNPEDWYTLLRRQLEADAAHAPQATRLPLKAPEKASPADPAPDEATGSHIGKKASSNTASVSDTLPRETHASGAGDEVHRHTPSTTRDSAADAATPWRRDLDRAIQGLERELSAASNMSQRAGGALSARLRLMYLAAGREQEAIQLGEGISATERQFWDSEIFGLSALLDEQRLPDPQLRAAFANRELRRATQRLGEIGLLDVRNLAFCREVSSFGIYQPLHEGPDRFRPGQEALLYAEVENFSSRQTPRGFETSLKARYEIRDHRGRVTAEGDFDTLTETCRNYRRDFFLHYRVRVPRDTLRGSYTLHLHVEDGNSGKQGESYIPFEVVTETR